MIVRSVLFVVAGLVFIALAGLPARLYLGQIAALHCITAVVMCLIPGLLTLLWAEWTLNRDPQQTPLIALGASGVRMFVVLTFALLLYTQVPLFRETEGFLFWVLGAYLYLLAVEIVLLLWGRPGGPSGSTPSQP